MDASCEESVFGIVPGEWNGAQWSTLGDGTSGTVSTLTTDDDATAPASYAGSDFISAGNVVVNRIGAWRCTAALGAAQP